MFHRLMSWYWFWCVCYLVFLVLEKMSNGGSGCLHEFRSLGRVARAGLVGSLHIDCSTLSWDWGRGFVDADKIDTHGNPKDMSNCFVLTTFLGCCRCLALIAFHQ